MEKGENMKRLLTVLLIGAVAFMPTRVQAKEPTLETRKTTFYCPESAGQITATGQTVRYGICAVDKAHMGLTAGIYSEDMTEFYGWFECLDTGGETVQNGTIDVWFPDMDSGREWLLQTEGTVKVLFINAKG